MNLEIDRPMDEQAYTNEFEHLTVGERLRRAREAKGMSLEEIASQTRIPVRHLQHIEKEEWDALPAITYCVGFVRSYANAVGLDGSELGRELRDRLGGMRTRAPIAEYYQPADPARVPPRWLAIFAVGFAALLIVLYLLFRSGGDSEPTTVTAPVAEAPAPQAAQPQQPAAPSPQSAAGQPVILTATGPVWLRVYEEGGATIVERTLAAGESLQIPATAARPMLRVGAPEALRITVGQTVIPQLGPAGSPVGNVSARPEDLIARAQGQPTAAAPAAIPPAAPTPIPPQ